MRRIPIIGAALAAALPGGQASARPLNWNCDTPGGNYSILEMAQDGPAYRIVGRVTPVLFRRHQRWSPMATVRIEISQGNAVAIRLTQTTGNRLEARLAQSVGGRFEERAFAWLDRGTAAPFELSLSPTGEVVAVFGPARATTRVPSGTGAEVSLSCSTGEFLFEGVELEARD